MPQDEDLRRILLDTAQQLLDRLRPEPPAALSDPQRRILATLTAAPQTGRKVARLAGATYNSTFRQNLAELVRQGFARKRPEGYTL